VAPEDWQRLATLFPSFRDFVDDALFHPEWGYYSTGRVRFGDGGHYETYPIALSPFFGRMVAGYAYRLWRRRRRPRRFEICELGAGNGQLCLDVLSCLERSPALITRQRATLGPLAARVVWTRADLSRRRPRGVPFADCGLIVANEVLDCLAHQKIVSQPGEAPTVSFVLPLLRAHADTQVRTVTIDGVGAAVPRAALGEVLARNDGARDLRFREVQLPLAAVPGLQTFVERRVPELLTGRREPPPYYACPSMQTMLRNSTELYRDWEALWIDYGEDRSFHLRAAERRRVFAGPPRSGAGVYDRPGWDDITFLVDFSLARQIAEDAGATVRFYGPQGELARRSGVSLDETAVETMLQHRILHWMLAVAGAGAEQDWRKGGLTWSGRRGGGGRVLDGIRAGVDEFVGKRRTAFKLLVLASRGRGAR
jgi:SAM-dependent MidA family methyltransferase